MLLLSTRFFHTSAPDGTGVLLLTTRFFHTSAPHGREGKRLISRFFLNLAARGSDEKRIVNGKVVVPTRRPLNNKTNISAPTALLNSA